MSANCPHCGGRLSEDSVVEWGGWYLDERNRRVDPGNIHLAPQLAIILSALLRARGATVTYDALFMKLYGDTPSEHWPDSGGIQVRMVHLRKRIGARIKALYTAGYYILPRGESTDA